MSAIRLDILLVERNLAATRTQSQKMITAGQVKVNQVGVWQVVTKPSVKFELDTLVDVTLGDEQRYVSRAGLKLEAVLEHSGIDVTGLVALDIGQSTGGFTDCLLQRGCKKVVGIDVGHSQLHESLKNNTQVAYLEGVNARNLVNKDFDSLVPHFVDEAIFDLIVMDVSFISQTLILPQLSALLKNNGYLLSLVKPQFEVGKENIGKGGIVKDVRLFNEVKQNICGNIEVLGFNIHSYCESSITGGDGNKEFVVVAQKNDI